jgi:flagellar hook assembly protein FlgD
VTLAWTQPDAAPVTITVTDVAGRQVRRVVDRRSESPGPHAVEWRGDGEDGRRVAPGVYFARLLVGPHSISQRLVVIR